MAKRHAPHLVVLTGAGISAESGIQTFRASDGFWADHASRTSLAVMPAASLLQYASLDAPCVLVDPEAQALAPPGVVPLKQSAGQRVPSLVRHWQREGRLWFPETLLREA